MKQKIKIKKQLLLFVLILGISSISISFCSCLSTKLEKCPYSAYCKFDEIEFDAENMDYVFFIENLCNKEIKEFSVVLSLYNSDGEPAFYGCDFINHSFARNIPEGDILEFSIPIESYFEDFDDEVYFTDYFYVNKIVYADNSVWEDPFGLWSL
jgi:hypothetical protein